MGKCFITIGREFGSGGHKVGESLANSLGLSYYDNELILLAAKRSGIDLKSLEKYDEKKTNPLFFEANYSGNDNVVKGESFEDTLFTLQKDTILEIASNCPAIFVGRCADYILRENNFDVLSIFIAAPLEQRIKRISALNGLEEKESLNLIKKKDKTRRKYYEAHTGKKWGVSENYDFYYDTSRWDMSEIIDDIAKKYKNR